MWARIEWKYEVCVTTYIYLWTGLEILAFPCNQFLKQEPDSSEKVEEFACTRFNATYPIFQKVSFQSSLEKKMLVFWNPKWHIFTWINWKFEVWTDYQLFLCWRFVLMDQKQHLCTSFWKQIKGDFLGQESNGTSPSF